ncbi:MAG TPA: hypothetical protein VNN18_07010 [Candidatus Xenobia bacterium]|nr:hypothetical protein [Candidatus Xenobia bacterium]
MGAAKPYRQHYFEVGWHQEMSEKVFFEVNAYARRGDDGFENGEISNTRLFVPINFARTHAKGIERTVGLRHLERLGLEARLQYALARATSFGPITGGLLDEELQEGERIRPAFDQRHTGTAMIFYRRPWRNLRAGFILRYGSGTPKEEHVEVNGEEVLTFERLPQHFTADFSTGVALWQREARRLDFEFNVTNLGNDIYQIAKESETTPVQFSARRVVSGRLSWHF